MNCTRCGFENREGVRFCEECGAELELLCPRCEARIPSGRKFCGECGNPLSLPSEGFPKRLSFDEKIQKIQRYLPERLTEKILSQRDKIEGERKQVTVMFCDMQGFTPLTEALGTEEAYAVMDQVYNVLIHQVHRYEGTVNEMTGDGIMALFGAPIALEDAPQRAIRSAYAIHREITKFGDKLRGERAGLPLVKMRIGIHTGPVVVGALGNDLRVEFKAVGETVNLASRMQELAEPGSTYVTQDTFRHTEGFFRFEALGERSVKGIRTPVKIYRVIAPSTRRTRFDVSAERGLTPFIGRERDLELLLDGFERVKSGAGQAFSIIGEAGVGKSRLLYEFRKAVANENATFLEGKCLSYSRGVAYHPVIDILKSNFDIMEGDGDERIREKVERGLKILQTDDPSTLPFLLELMSVKDSGIDLSSLSPEARRDRTIEAVLRIALKGAEIRPVIMAIEDLHWIDRSSEEQLQYLLRSISGSRVLLIFTYRPEFTYGWGGKSYHNQLILNRLSNRESLAMAAHILGTVDIEGDLEELILEKTEGVPFFIEEFIKYLTELQIIGREGNKARLARETSEVTIPSTIQDVIMTRVDSLFEGAKEVLQTGCVIEREFSYGLINRAAGVDQHDLLSYLSELKDAELLYERGIYPQSTYIFRHALTREVIYDSLLSTRRKKLHGIIADCIEEEYHDSIDAHYLVLAEHYIASGNYEKGARYARMARKKAEKTGLLKEAIECSKKEITCLENLPQTEKVKREIVNTNTKIGLYYSQIIQLDAAKKQLESVMDLAKEIAYEKPQSRFYTIIGNHDLFVEENFESAFSNLQKAIELSEKFNDFPSLLTARNFLAHAFAFSCDFEKALYYFERGLELNVQANALWGISLGKSHIGIFVHNLRGELDRAMKNGCEAIEIGERSGDSLAKSIAHICLAWTYYYKGFMHEAMSHLTTAIDYLEKTKVYSWCAFAHLCLGFVRFEMATYKESISAHSESISLFESANIYPSFVLLNKAAIARTSVLGNPDAIDPMSLFEHEKSNRFKFCEGWMKYLAAEALLIMGCEHIPRAEQLIREAIDSDGQNGLKWYCGMDHALYSRLLEQMGEQSRANEKIKEAIGFFEDCGATGWAEKMGRKLADQP